MDQLWRKLAALQGTMLETSKGRKPFDVVKVDEQSSTAVVIVPRSTGKPRKIMRDEIERAFAFLANNGSIMPSRLRKSGVSEANPAYVAAILRAIREQP